MKASRYGKILELGREVSQGSHQRRPLKMTPSSTSPRHKILLVSGSVLAQLALLLLVHPVFAAVVPLAGFLLLREEEDLFSAFWRATLLGGVACAGVLAATSLLWPLVLFGWYLIVLSFFHLSEYLATAATNPGEKT